MLICPLILTLSSGSCKGRWFGERRWFRKYQDRECRCTICLWCDWHNQVISATDCGLTQDLVVHVKGSKPSGSKSVVKRLRNTNKVDFIISVVLVLRKWFSLLCPWIWIGFLDIFYFYYFFKFKLETPWNPIENCQSALHLGNSFWKLPAPYIWKIPFENCHFLSKAFSLLHPHFVGPSRTLLKKPVAVLPKSWCSSIEKTKSIQCEGLNLGVISFPGERSPEQDFFWQWLLGYVSHVWWRVITRSRKVVGGGGGDKCGGLHPNSLFLKQQFCWDSLFGY